MSGYCFPVIGLVNVFLGLYDWGVNPLWMLLWGIYCALVLIVFLIFEIRKTRKDKNVQQEISQYYEKGGVPLNSNPNKVDAIFFSLSFVFVVF